MGGSVLSLIELLYHIIDCLFEKHKVINESKNKVFNKNTFSLGLDLNGHRQLQLVNDLKKVKQIENDIFWIKNNMRNYSYKDVFVPFVYRP